MDALINEVMERTGLREDQAYAAAEAVVSFLKEHLPEPAANMVSQFLGGPDGADKEAARKKKAAIATIAATTAAVNVVVLPGAH